MYKQYLNDYEKRADQIRKAARAIEAGEMPAPNHVSPKITSEIYRTTEAKENPIAEIFKKFSTDDILLLVLIFVLATNDDRDMTLIVILGYLFLSGF